ncbi:deoxyribose-phosphate aldolase [Anaerococcus lactolyticus]|uniref:deoxyribose-phosphate aldolase n=1 Tax=Anaerococcus lactolyticus TaxID=33032 RepID=UPI00288C2FAA|nr:deoxyribose-phosphate aldolase [Anaerococcus lactolyticus]
MTKQYTLKELRRFVDHTNLHADASREDMKKLCQEAMDYNFKMVAINSVQSKACAEFLKDSDVHVGAAIGFPLGQQTIATKVFETEDAIKNGADEIDYVINLTEVVDGNFDYIKDEMEQIVKICRDNNVISKVIFENCYLNKDQIRKLAEISKEVKPDFIKTSTGFGPSGATEEDVKLMKEVVGDTVKVKAAGGIRDVDTFIAMIKNGAERIGTSSGIKISEELEKLVSDQGTIEI